jgi:hypothetical protein
MIKFSPGLVDAILVLINDVVVHDPKEISL